jgi:hypothetical protein
VDFHKKALSDLEITVGEQVVENDRVRREAATARSIDCSFRPRRDDKELDV